MDIEEILKRRQAPSRTVRFLLDQDLADRFREAEREAGRAKARAEHSNDRAVQLEAARLAGLVEDLRQRVEDERVEFTFRGIPRVTWNELVEQHPPTPEDRESGFEFHPHTFGPALIAACAVDPEMTLEQAERLWAEWTDAEVVRLFNAAYESNKVVRDVPFTGAGSGTTPTSGTRSGSATE